MGIFRRTADIFAASLNDIVDRFEEPERMLRHALREMDSLLEVTSSAVARSIATEKLLEKARAEHADQADTWRRRSGEALAAGDETLARQAIARKLDHQRATGTLDRQLADAREANATLRGQLDVLRDKRAAARTKLTMLSAQQAAAAAQRQALASSRAPATHTKALARFERFYEQVEFAQAEAVALLELEADADTLFESQFDRQETERAIDAELAQLKACHPSAPQ